MNIGLLLAEIALTLGRAATEGHITKREAVDFVAGAADATLIPCLLYTSDAADE